MPENAFKRLSSENNIIRKLKKTPEIPTRSQISLWSSPPYFAPHQKPGQSLSTSTPPTFQHHHSTRQPPAIKMNTPSAYFDPRLTSIHPYSPPTTANPCFIINSPAENTPKNDKQPSNQCPTAPKTRLLSGSRDDPPPPPLLSRVGNPRKA